MLYCFFVVLLVAGLYLEKLDWRAVLVWVGGMGVSVLAMVLLGLPAYWHWMLTAVADGILVIIVFGDNVAPR